MVVNCCRLLIVAKKSPREPDRVRVAWPSSVIMVLKSLPLLPARLAAPVLIASDSAPCALTPFGPRALASFARLA